MGIYLSCPCCPGESRTGGGQQIVRRVSKQALGKVAGPHRFRHTYACAYLANGDTIDSLRYLLGHASLTMVMHYAEATKARRAVDEAQKLSPVERLLG
jgi:integrase/recombinase XerD